MDELIIYDDSTILDNITINGRISKKLFEKLVVPKLKEIERLKSALEFYANIKSWNNTFSIGSSDWEDVHYGPSMGDFHVGVGGKLAREVLSE